MAIDRKSLLVVSDFPSMRRIRQSVRWDQKRDGEQHCAEHRREYPDSDQHAARGKPHGRRSDPGQPGAL